MPLLKVLLASSEVTPFSKTGGLADVCGALPTALAQADCDVTVFTPAYRCTRQKHLPVETTGVRFDIPIGGRIVSGQLLKSHLPDSAVPVYLVEQDDYYDRAELYRSGGEDYRDNCERFIFFSRAVLEAVSLLGLEVDLIHCHDWQTGLIPAYLRIDYQHARGYDQIATLLTIHNLAYQGQFWHWDMMLTGLDWKYFNWQQMEFHGYLNLLKTGIVFADSLSTVSPRYAQEIQTVELGCGLDDLLRHRASSLSGIINGVDYRIWNPETDKHLVTPYSVDDFAGKAICKKSLQQEFGLPIRPDAPLIGFIGRLASQKGVDLALPIIKSWVQQVDAQWVLLGTGDPKLERQLTELARKYPQRLAVSLSFQEAQAHRIEAGADLFLMPSQYEPCGLNQLYSLKYGTVPVVHRTGGLADSVSDTNPHTIATRSASGFSFANFDSSALEEALHRAVSVYGRDPSLWQQIVQTGMRQDWSWDGSARQYRDLYHTTLARRESRIRSGSRT
jgi:starch synthase